MNLPNISGGKKLIYTHLKLPLIALNELSNYSEKMYQDLDLIVKNYNGQWSPEAEQFLLKKMHQGYKMKESYIAIDIGASSGRAIAGYIENDQLKLKELSRNGPINIRGQLCLDFLHLYRQIQDGLRTAKDQYITRSLAIDTWGVDFGLIDSSGHLIDNPIHYRDNRTSGIIEKLSETITKKEIFDQTVGIQFMELNTLNQIYALYLQSLMLIQMRVIYSSPPDLLNYWLTGRNFQKELFQVHRKSIIQKLKIGLMNY